MLKHIITTIQQEKAEENKEKNWKSHRKRRNTNGCVAIHNKYYHKPKQKVERTQVKRLSNDTIFFSLKTNTMRWNIKKKYPTISTCYSKIENVEQSQVSWKSIMPNSTNINVIVYTYYAELNNTFDSYVGYITRAHCIPAKKDKMRRNHIGISTKICSRSA